MYVVGEVGDDYVLLCFGDDVFEYGVDVVFECGEFGDIGVG